MTSSCFIAPPSPKVFKGPSFVGTRHGEACKLPGSANPSREASQTLGWPVTTKEEPRYWLEKGAQPGARSETDLVRVPAKTMATHTVGIPQAGAGKSTFLGRLVEELPLQTHSQSVILDSNSDFRRVHEMRPTDLWDKAVSAASRGRGKLPADLLHQTLTFGLERARLAGRWGSPGPQVVHPAARRTVEGGRSLGTVPRASAPPGQEKG